LNLILNEQKYIASVLDGSIKDDVLTTTIRTLVKYYVIKEESKDDIVSKIEKYLSDRLQSKYKARKWEDYIFSIVTSTLKTKRSYDRDKKEFKLNEIDSVFISLTELERIKLIENINAERIAFVLLVCGKINRIIGKNNKIGTYCNREFFKDCGLSFSNANRNLINHLKQLGYATPSDNHQSSFVEINIADEDGLNGEEGIKIEDFREYVLLYEKWRGEKVDYCGCGQPIRILSNRSKYCKMCGKDEWKKYNAQKQKEYRKNKKNK